MNHVERLDQLPIECLYSIFQKLDTPTLFKVKEVCRLFNEFITNNYSAFNSDEHKTFVARKIANTQFDIRVVKKMIFERTDQLGSFQVAEHNAVFEKFIENLQKSIEQQFIDIFSKKGTLVELVSILKFFRSSSGQKYLSLTDKLSSKMMKIQQNAIPELFNDLLSIEAQQQDPE